MGTSANEPGPAAEPRERAGNPELHAPDVQRAESEEARDQRFIRQSRLLQERLRETVRSVQATLRSTQEIVRHTRSERTRRAHHDAADNAEGERTVVRRALRESERAITLRDQFVALVAHEMRQPLQAAAAAAMLFDGDTSAATRARASAVLRRQIERLARLVEDLLDSARLAAHGVDLHIQRVELGAIMRGVVRDLQHRVDDRHQELIVRAPDRPVPFAGDDFRLHQVCVNLLENAARYTPAGGRIWFEGRSTPSNQIEIVVRDNGPGIAPEAQPHLFDLFVRAERSGEGIGVGLAVVRELVALHGGVVSVTSQPGHGAEFVVRLPITGPLAHAATEPQGATARIVGQ